MRHATLLGGGVHPRLEPMGPLAGNDQSAWLTRRGEKRPLTCAKATLVVGVGMAGIRGDHGDEVRDRWEREYDEINDETVLLPGAKEAAPSSGSAATPRGEGAPTGVADTGNACEQ